VELWFIANPTSRGKGYDEGGGGGGGDDDSEYMISLRRYRKVEPQGIMADDLAFNILHKFMRSSGYAVSL